MGILVVIFTVAQAILTMPARGTTTAGPAPIRRKGMPSVITGRITITIGILRWW